MFESLFFVLTITFFVSSSFIFDTIVRKHPKFIKYIGRKLF